MTFFSLDLLVFAFAFYGHRVLLTLSHHALIRDMAAVTEKVWGEYVLNGNG